MSSRGRSRPPSDSRTSSVNCSKASAAESAWTVVIEPGWPELTLRRYLEKACSKLRVRTRIEAVAYAVGAGLIDPS